MAETRTIQFIGGHEGKVLTWYLDPTHTPTIGYGATWASAVFRDWFLKTFGRKMRKGDTITETQALEVLKLMVETEYEPPVKAAMPNAKPQVKAASTSMVYNAGPGSLSWKWAKAFARGDIQEGARLLRTTATTSKGKKLPGLVRRRNEEADIAALNKWPAWLGTINPSPTEAPASYISLEDRKQAQLWLKKLGYYKGAIDGIAGGLTIDAARRFQRDHGTLKVDGIIGKATLSALQRASDLQSKGIQWGTGGAGTIGTGIAEGATGASDAVTPATGIDTSWLEPLLIWGGVAILIVGAVYLAWRYQDEINTLVRRL